MEQRSPEWHALRASKIGASDAPTILGASPWSTPHELWCVKTGRKASDFKSNWAIDRGCRWEDAARAKYELLTGLELPPAVVVSDEYEWMMASTDGYSAEKSIVLEIKIPGREVFEAAKRGVVHEKYRPQLHHQRLVCKAREVHFWCCKVEKVNGVEQITDTALVVVTEDKDFERALMAQLVAFWELVQRDQAPPLGERDTMILDGEEAVSLFARLKAVKEAADQATLHSDQAKEKEKAAKAAFDEVRAEAIAHLEKHGHPRLACLDVTATKSKADVWRIIFPDVAEKHQAEG